MVLQQAMAAGKAVVASRIGGFADIVDDGRTGLLVDPENAEAFSDHLYTLLASEKLRKRLGNAGKEEARKRFDTKEVAQRTFQLYQHIIGEGSNRPSRRIPAQRGEERRYYHRYRFL
jgi:glycosyltransferase involved in cell wall biosynthesis